MPELLACTIWEIKISLFCEGGALIEILSGKELKNMWHRKGMQSELSIVIFGVQHHKINLFSKNWVFWLFPLLIPLLQILSF